MISNLLIIGVISINSSQSRKRNVSSWRRQLKKGRSNCYCSSSRRRNRKKRRRRKRKEEDKKQKG
jgi:murein L,D-transpeptidase YafK